MNLNDYMFSEAVDKRDWLNSIKMNVGLPYFGGKSVIGRYIFNNIFNLSIEMSKKGQAPQIFIDSFTGGGKMGLSIPNGWYDTIVINDLDYGVYSYYVYCKENYIALIKMIEKIGEIMSKEVFHVAAYIRRFREGCEKWDNGEKVAKDEAVDPLTAAALTFWVTSAAFNNMTAPDSTSYNLARLPRDKDGNLLGEGDNVELFISKKDECEEIRKVTVKAKRIIPQLHEQLNSRDYRIENLDYRELIKKYNGKVYKDLNNEEHQCKELGEKTKLWYFDPPYHPLCLYAGKNAPYAETFSESMANEMTDILAGEKEEEYGAIEYFIKSDYDPKETLYMANRDVNNTAIDGTRRGWYKEILEREKNNNEISRLFEKLEKYPFCKVCVGGFDKGSVRSDGNRSIGMEYIWCRGFDKEYEKIEGVQR